jgi:hypothetical protein
MILDTTLDQTIGRKLLADNSRERQEHLSSGKLSAGALGQPRQWQVLKAIGVPGKEIEEYVLRKFKRGIQVEDWITSHMGTGEPQKYVEYRNVVGFVDKLMIVPEFYGEDWIEKVGTLLPREVKSVTNMKFKWLNKTKEADIGHRLQGSLYALSLGLAYYAIDYVASDDFRIMSLIYDVRDTRDEVERIIGSFDAHVANGIVPVFEPYVDWQKNPDYNNYPDWVGLSADQVMRKLTTEFPEQAANLADYPAYLERIQAERDKRTAKRELEAV